MTWAVVAESADTLESERVSVTLVAEPEDVTTLSVVVGACEDGAPVPCATVF